MQPSPGTATASLSFYSDLERLLSRQLGDNPRLHHVRIKLIDLYYETGRREEFLREARLLASGFDRRANPVEWKRVMGMGRLLGIADPLFRETHGDSIEFTGEFVAVAAPTATGHRRFGDDPVSRPLFQRLASAYETVRADRRFLAEFDLELMHQLNRPSSLYHARMLTQKLGGAQLYFKREDLSPPGTRYSISVIGQALLARRLGLGTLVTFSNNGQRGVVVAGVAARMGLRAVVYMDKDDVQRHSALVARMRLHGATVTPVDRRLCPGGDLRQAALEHWQSQHDKTFLLMGLDAAPAPFPQLGNDLAGVIGREVRRQSVALAKRLPDVVVARAGDNADAVGFLDVFLGDAETRLVCVEGNREFADGAAPTPVGADPKRTFSDSEQRVAGAIMERLEYPSVTREHATLKASGRVEYPRVPAVAAKAAIADMCRLEGILPAIQTAHAVAWACRQAQSMKPEQVVVMMLAENSDKDVWEITRALGIDALAMA